MIAAVYPASLQAGLALVGPGKWIFWLGKQACGMGWEEKGQGNWAVQDGWNGKGRGGRGREGIGKLGRAGWMAWEGCSKKVMLPQDGRLCQPLPLLYATLSPLVMCPFVVLKEGNCLPGKKKLFWIIESYFMAEKSHQRDAISLDINRSLIFLSSF